MQFLRDLRDQRAVEQTLLLRVIHKQGEETLGCVEGGFWEQEPEYHSYPSEFQDPCSWNFCQGHYLAFCVEGWSRILLGV